MSDYFEMRDALFKQYMKKAHWQCYPRGFSPMTRDVPTYTIVCTLDTPDGIIVEDIVINAIEWEQSWDKGFLFRLTIHRIVCRILMAWHAS